MKTSLEERGAVIVTGATGGIGRQLVLALLDAGARVVAADLSADPTGDISAAASKHVGRLESIAIDLTAAGAEDRVASAAIERFGSIFALVNNAGIGRSSFWRNRATAGPRFWEVDIDTWRRFFEINAHVPFRMSRAVVEHMVRNGGGRIINVTTSLESMLNTQMAPYGPSKASAEALSAVMAKDLAGSGVTVNVVIPGGPTDTQMVAERPDVARSALLRPEIMAPPVLWLLSPEAANTNGRRFIAWKWGAPPVAGEAAAERSSDPIAWSQLAVGSMRTPTI